MVTREAWLAALTEKHGAARQRAFSRARVAVCGLGGLGSNIAIALTRAGVGELLLIDYDTVEVSNLNRQQYKLSQVGMRKVDALLENLAEIQPFTKREGRAVKLTAENAPELLAGCDVICEAFDGPEEKAMLTNAVLEHLPGTPYVAASGMAGLGSPNAIQTRRLGANFYLAGDAVSDVGAGIGLYGARVLICAAHEATAVLRILAGEVE